MLRYFSTPLGYGCQAWWHVRCVLVCMKAECIFFRLSTNKKKGRNVCYLHLSRTVHLICVTFGRFVAEDPKELKQKRKGGHHVSESCFGASLWWRIPTYLRRMTSDERMPPENESTQSREWVNHWVVYRRVVPALISFRNDFYSQCNCSFISGIWLDLPRSVTTLSSQSINQSVSEVCSSFSGISSSEVIRRRFVGLLSPIEQTANTTMCSRTF